MHLQETALKKTIIIIHDLKNQRYTIINSSEQNNLLYGLQNGLSVFCSLQADLLSDYIGVFPLNFGSSFGLCLNTKQLILVSQLHLVLYGR